MTYCERAFASGFLIAEIAAVVLVDVGALALPFADGVLLALLFGGRHAPSASLSE